MQSLNTKMQELVTVSVARGRTEATRAAMHLIDRLGMPDVAMLVGLMDVDEQLDELDAERASTGGIS